MDLFTAAEVFLEGTGAGVVRVSRLRRRAGRS
jgi:branched-subunit amino acid aminotransferase/4-amino-4-deoxychorismate lyase